MKKRKIKKLSKLQIPDKIVIEVLKRLPAKSLMQFKCACKTGHRLICNHDFAESHKFHSHSRPDASYMLFSIGFGEAGIETIIPANPQAVFSSQILVQTFHKYCPCSNIVNGLICLRHKTHLTFKYTISTVGRRKNMPSSWDLETSYECKGFKESYTLGFDLVTKKYKLLYQHNSKRNAFRFCKILTLGNRSWRPIGRPPDWPPRRKAAEKPLKAIIVHGVMCWMDEFRMKGERVIECFEVGKERFGRPFAPESAQNMMQLCQVGGDLTLLYKKGDCHNSWMNSACGD